MREIVIHEVGMGPDSEGLIHRLKVLSPRKVLNIKGQPGYNELRAEGSFVPGRDMVPQYGPWVLMIEAAVYPSPESPALICVGDRVYAVAQRVPCQKVTV